MAVGSSLHSAERGLGGAVPSRSPESGQIPAAPECLLFLLVLLVQGELRSL